MKLVSKIKDVKRYLRQAELKHKSIGFVPTMGALHKGHISLIKRAVRENDFVAVSIFVNPIQFGKGEDFKRYPRVLKKDCSLCRIEGVDIVFNPDIKELYPPGYKTYVDVACLSDELCGKFRPGHFKGVATVVTKFFNIVRPQRAYFGQKDAQQVFIIKKLARDLNFPVEIRVLPTVRESDGLALSSRNVYLTRKQREDAAVLFQSLNLARKLAENGLKDAAGIISRMKQMIGSKAGAKIDYITIVDLENLRPIRKVKGACLAALAVWFGKTRLIDNIILKIY